jgi:hypothetical protein
MIRIYADENERDDQDRYLLHIAGSRRDIELYCDQIAEGLEVTLNVQDEFEVRAKLTFDKVWRAVPDMTSIRFLNPEDAPK